MSTVALVASYGLELAEVGGTLARHVQEGDDVHAAFLLARDEAREPLGRAAAHLGVKPCHFLDAEHGSLDGAEGRELRDRLVRWLRAVRPTVVLMPDPEHALVDLDPDRRYASTLVLEAVSLAGRDWREQELGPETGGITVHFYAPASPTFVIDVTETFEAKLRALGELAYQAEYSEAVLRERVSTQAWSTFESLVSGSSGAGLLEILETAHAVHHGAAGHGTAAFAEAFRSAHPPTLNLLPT